MNMSERGDVAAIQALIARQFASLNWDPGTSGDWQSFAADFFPDAALYPMARPARRQSVGDFIEGMKGLQQANVRSFHERVLGTQIQVFGHIAVAVAACEIVENNDPGRRGLKMLLLIRNEGKWQIVAQAWDNETPARRLPAHLLAACS